MRFVQASDFHIDSDEPQRLEALEQVVALANQVEADALLIPGDLFDSDHAATLLRPEVRARLERFAGTTVLLPGNHDANGFPPEADYGDRAVVLGEAPHCRHRLAGANGDRVDVVGTPYQPSTTLGQALAGFESEDPLSTILLAHGTLRGAGMASVADEGDECAYFPILPEDLQGRFVYSALGHLHARATFDQWTAEAAWGYAGSPIAITRGEEGPRHAVVVDLDPGRGVREVRRQRLETSYWISRAIFVYPWQTPGEAIDHVRHVLAEMSLPHDPQRGIRLRIEGWMDADEGDFRAAVEQEIARHSAAHREVEPDLAVRGAAALLSQCPEIDDLLRRVRKKGADQEVGDETIRMAAGLLMEAASGVR